MSTSLSANGSESRRERASPRPRGRENAKNTPCRNIGIYGFCRYENDGCAYNHDSTPRNTTHLSTSSTSESSTSSRRFNVESPSFTPLQPQANGIQPPRASAISPRSAHAAPFTPKASKPSKFHRISARLILIPLLRPSIFARSTKDFATRSPGICSSELRSHSD